MGFSEQDADGNPAGGAMATMCTRLGSVFCGDFPVETAPADRLAVCAASLRFTRVPRLLCRRERRPELRERRWGRPAFRRQTLFCAGLTVRLRNVAAIVWLQSWVC